MNSKENYTPSQDEINEAQNAMTDTQRKDSETRAKNWEQEQLPWEPFDDKHIDENFERKPITSEQENELNHRLEELGEVFKNSNLNWHLDGALNISLMNGGKYIGYHKDVDVSVEKEELAKLEAHLLKNGYGLFLSRTEGKEKNKVMRRVGYENFHDSETEHMMIAAIDEKGKIRRDKFLNFVDVHIAERNAERQLLGKVGIVLPEKWAKPYPIELQGQQINLSHPGKVLYFKLHQGRDYDPTDIKRFIETGKLTIDDFNEVEKIIENEFIEKKIKGKQIFDEVASKIKPQMSADEILNIFSENVAPKKLGEAFNIFVEKIKESEDKSSDTIFQLAVEFFDVEGKENKMREKIKKVRLQLEDLEKIREVRGKLEKYN